MGNGFVTDLDSHLKNHRLPQVVLTSFHCYKDVVRPIHVVPKEKRCVLLRWFRALVERLSCHRAYSLRC
jgi:hypothetical protein